MSNECEPPKGRALACRLMFVDFGVKGANCGQTFVARHECLSGFTMHEMLLMWVKGRSDSELDPALELDRDYAESRSPATDFNVTMRTARVVTKGRRAK